jgi:hypothetical protein
MSCAPARTTPVVKRASLEEELGARTVLLRRDGAFRGKLPQRVPMDPEVRRGFTRVKPNVGFLATSAGEPLPYRLGKSVDDRAEELIDCA